MSSLFSVLFLFWSGLTVVQLCIFYPSIHPSFTQITYLAKGHWFHISFFFLSYFFYQLSCFAFFVDKVI